MSMANEDGEPSLGRKRPRSTLLTLGGGMTIVAGVLALINGLRAMVGNGEVSFGLDIGLTRYTFCAFIVLLFGALAITGGVFALKGRHLSLSLAGAVFGMMGGGLIGFYLGLVALVLFGLSDADL